MTDIREDLKAYVDGELPESRAKEIEAALSADPALAAEVDVLRKLSFEITQVARDLEVQGASETLAKLRRPRRNPFLLPVFATAACLVVVAITYPRSPEILSQNKAISRERTAVAADSSTAAGASVAPNRQPNSPDPKLRQDITKSVAPVAVAKGESKKTDAILKKETRKAENERAKSTLSYGFVQPADVEITIASLDDARKNIVAMSAPGDEAVSLQDSRISAGATYGRRVADPSLVEIRVPLSQVKSTLDAIRQLDVTQAPHTVTANPNRNTDLFANPSSKTGEAASPPQVFRGSAAGATASGGLGGGGVKASAPIAKSLPTTAKPKEQLVTLRIRLKVRQPAAAKRPPN